MGYQWLIVNSAKTESVSQALQVFIQHCTAAFSHIFARVPLAPDCLHPVEEQLPQAKFQRIQATLCFSCKDQTSCYGPVDL